jgi:hypothetical protein
VKEKSELQRVKGKMKIESRLVSIDGKNELDKGKAHIRPTGEIRVLMGPRQGSYPMNRDTSCAEATLTSDEENASCRGIMIQ